jgi:Phosphodiester glycosidase/Bacterial SH3 domain
VDGILLAALAAQIFTLSAPREMLVGQPASLALTRDGQPVPGAEVRVLGPGRVHGVVSVALLNVRAAAETTAPVLASLYRGESVLVLHEGADGWCRVVTAVGRTGFSACEFLERSPFGQPLGRTDEAGKLAANALGVAPGVLTLAAMRGGEVLARADVLVKPYEYDRREAVGPGLTYRELRLVRAGDGPFTLQVLEVDPKSPAVNLLPVRAQDRAIGRETVSAMARRLGAAAAVNGGYFITAGPYAGGSSGAFLGKGEVVALPGSGTPRTALVFCSEKDDVERLEFEPVGFVARVSSSTGGTAVVTGLHRARGGDDLILYRPFMGERTLTDASGAEAQVDSQGRVAAWEEGKGDMAIPRDGYVLSGSGAGAEWLRAHARPGSRIALELQPRVTSCTPANITGGGPRLVRAGRVDLGEEGFAHESVRHPRTAVAVTKGGALLFVTLDGRQASSVGMTLTELAELLIELGASEAMNLDGGGSTTMLIYTVGSVSELEKLKLRAVEQPLLQRVLPEAERGAKATSSSSAARTPGSH